MFEKINNITLIGMPGSGKTTLGKLLAKKINFEFTDCDRYIEKQEKMKLQKIINTKGDEGFCEIEEKRIIELLPREKNIFSPGGSVIYSKKLMEVLKKSSFIVFLDLPLKVIKRRLTNKSTRGIVGLRLKSIEQLYKERMLLYRKYSDITINCFKKANNEIIEEIIKKLEMLKIN